MLLFSKAATNSLKLETPIEIGQSQKEEIVEENQKILTESASSEVEKTTENQTTIVRGSFDDASVKRALIAALLGQNNPGVRIKSISTLADHAEREAYKPDVKIKNALIKSMKKDSNPVVRSEALNILKKYPFDNEIRDALLYVLANDKNPGLRVSAINALTDIKLQGILIDEVVKQVLTKRVEADKNKFVKYRAASILKEVE
jgi:HEAT repeat protein